MAMRKRALGPARRPAPGGAEDAAPLAGPLDVLSAEVSEAERYYAEISRFPILTPARERELAARMRAGDREAKQELFECNLRWVWSVAGWYATARAPLVDLAQVGAESMWEHMERFDPARGRFTTWLTLILTRDISRAATEMSSHIHRPWLVVQREKQLARALEAHLVATGETPTLEVLAERLALSPETTCEVQAETKRRPVQISLDAARGYGGRTARPDADVVPDAVDALLAAAGVVAPSGEEEGVQAAVSAEVTALVASVLTARELEVIALRFGEDLTLEKTARLLKPPITRERARQLEASALRKLRAHRPAAEALRRLYELS